jgi:hypothetical protein
MSHVLKKKRYLEVRRKTARIHSGSTISAKALLRAMDKEKTNGTKKGSTK